MLPFTAETLSALFEQYNRAIWPAQIFAHAIGFVLVLLAIRPVPSSGRLIGFGLAAAWAWTGWIFHLRYLAPLDFSAPVYAAAFLLQAALLGWTLVARNGVAFRFRSDLAGWAGLGLIGISLFVYPAIAAVAEPGLASARLFGVAPGPTAVFTLGVLLLANGRTPLHLTIIPFLWTLAGGTTAWFLIVPEDLMLLPAGIGGLCLIIWKNRSLPKGIRRQ